MGRDDRGYSDFPRSVLALPSRAFYRLGDSTGDEMPQERLSKIWDMLGAGSRVLGWNHQEQGGKQLLTPLNGRNSWERSDSASRWQEIRGV